MWRVFIGFLLGIDALQLSNCIYPKSIASLDVAWMVRALKETVNSFNIDLVFSRENVNVVCLSAFHSFFGIFIYIVNESWMEYHSELYGLGQQLLSAHSGKLLTQSGFMAEWLNRRDRIMFCSISQNICK